MSQNGRQVRVSAYDSAYPDQQSNATLPVTVLRSIHAPVFDTSQYQLTVAENTPLGTSIIQLTATDSDNVRIFIREPIGVAVVTDYCCLGN